MDIMSIINPPSPVPALSPVVDDDSVPDRLLSPPVTPKEQQQEDDVIPPPPQQPLSSFKHVDMPHHRSSSKIFQFHLEREKALPPKFITISSSASKQQPPVITTGRRKKSIPHRSLPPTTADHVFSMDIPVTDLWHLAIQQQKQQMQQQPPRDNHGSGTAQNKKAACSKQRNMTPSATSTCSKKRKAVAAVDQQQQQQQQQEEQHMTSERHVKKAKTDAAAAYDRVDISIDDAQVFDNEWIPSLDAFDKKPGVRVHWKGTPLVIDHMRYFEKLHPGEAAIASTLRLTPEQYLKCKRTLILAAQEFAKRSTPFRKSDAQKLCRIDVNKVSTLWQVFGRLGWLGDKWPN